MAFANNSGSLATVSAVALLPLAVGCTGGTSVLTLFALAFGLTAMSWIVLDVDANKSDVDTGLEETGRRGASEGLHFGLASMRSTLREVAVGVDADGGVSWLWKPSTSPSRCCLVSWGAEAARPFSTSSP